MTNPKCTRFGSLQNVAAGFFKALHFVQNIKPGAFIEINQEHTAIGTRQIIVRLIPDRNDFPYTRDSRYLSGTLLRYFK